MNWTNSSMSSKGYENVVTAFFSFQDENFLYCFNVSNIEITSSQSYTLWLLLVFALVIVLIGYGTYLLYKEVKQRRRN